MNRIYGELVKNLLLLWRDRAGLLILFLMPALLVVIITLVQNNVYKLMGESAAKVLLVDPDGGELGKEIVAGMKGAVLTRELDGRPVTADEAKKLVAAGRFQACIIIPAGSTATLAELAGAEVRADLAGESHPKVAGPELAIYFDPTVLGVFRGGIQNGLHRHLGCSRSIRLVRHNQNERDHPYPLYDSSHLAILNRSFPF